MEFSNFYIKNLQTAEDIVQDVFYHIWKNRGKYQKIHNVKTYLLKAVKNASLKKIQRLKIQEVQFGEAVQFEFPDESSEDQLLTKELRKAIEQAIKELPPKCRIIFCMNRFDNLTYKEIAEVQSISVKTVETQISRAIKFLRKRLTHLIILTLSFVS